MSSIEILGTGFVKAQKKVTNFDLEKELKQVMNGLYKEQVFHHVM